MRAGSLKHKFILQQKTSIDDGLGGRQEVWVDEFVFNGSFESVSPSEQYNYSQLNIQINYVIITRYDNRLLEANDKRIKKDNRVLRIEYVQNTDDKRMLTLYVSEDIIK